jgi:hypothetical protein
MIGDATRLKNTNKDSKHTSNNTSNNNRIEIALAQQQQQQHQQSSNNNSRQSLFILAKFSELGNWFFSSKWLKFMCFKKKSSRQNSRFFNLKNRQISLLGSSMLPNL